MTRLAMWMTILGVVAVVACDWDGLRERERPNEPPTVRITGGATEGSAADYRVEFFWFGSDPDGTVDHFVYAIDDTCLCQYADTIQVIDPGTGLPVEVVQWVEPTDPEECRIRGIEPNYESVDSIWRRTDSYSGSFAFSAETDLGDTQSPYESSDWHTFYVKAVDDRGAESRADRRYFNALTIAPTIRLLAPTGEGEEQAQLVSTFVTLRWIGRDDDSVDPNKKPVGYQLKMVTLSSIFLPDDLVYDALRRTGRNFLIPDSLVVPDSVETDDRTFHQNDWWPKKDSPYRQEQFRLESLAENNYAIAIRGVDQAGAVTPDQALLIANERNNGNVVKLDVSEDIPVNPRLLITERNLLGSKLFLATGEEPWQVEVPVNVPLQFEWTADADWYGARVGKSNFAIDIADPGCEVCQENNGLGGWIGWGGHDRIPYPLVFGEQDANTQHILYVRVRDESFRPDREVLAQIVMNVVAFSFDKTALLVDDFKTVGINDCQHDAIVVPMVEQAIRPYLEVGEELDSWGRDRLPNCGEVNGRPDPQLSLLSRYKLLYWNVSSPGTGSIMGLVTDPNPTAEWGKYLSIYCRAGGNLIVWGRSVTGAMLGDFYSQDLAYTPELPLFTQWNFGPGTFLWDVMRLRTKIDRVGRGTERVLQIQCSGLVGLEATQTAIDEGFPVGVLDPSGYSTDGTASHPDDPEVAPVDPKSAIWLSSWSGRANSSGAPGVDGMTGLPPLKAAGMDTLYTFITNSWAFEESGTDSMLLACNTPFGSEFQDNPIIVRYDDPVGTQGKIVWIGTPLYFFQQNHEEDLHQLMARLTDWIFTN